MTDFFDWLTAADSGLAADRLREQFRLSEEEMRRTSEALAPAFLLGLQRLAAQPAAWNAFISRMSAAGTPEGQRSRGGGFGDLLRPLFGTSELADSIARQASTMTGISPDTIAKMMPELALMTVRTMMRMAGTPGAAPFAHGLPSDTGGLAMAEMMRRSANAVEAFSRPASAPSAASPQTYLEQLFADALRGGFPWLSLSGDAGARDRSSPSSGGATKTPPSPFFAFAPLFDAFARGARNGAANRVDGSSKQPRETRGTDRATGKAAVGAPGFDPLSGITQALDAGRAVQETYAREMLALFERHGRAD